MSSETSRLCQLQAGGQLEDARRIGPADQGVPGNPDLVEPEGPVLPEQVEPGEIGGADTGAGTRHEGHADAALDPARDRGTGPLWPRRRHQYLHAVNDQVRPVDAGGSREFAELPDTAWLLDRERGDGGAVEQTGQRRVVELWIGGQGGDGRAYRADEAGRSQRGSGRLGEKARVNEGRVRDRAVLAVSWRREDAAPAEASAAGPPGAVLVATRLTDPRAQRRRRQFLAEEPRHGVDEELLLLR